MYVNVFKIIVCVFKYFVSCENISHCLESFSSNPTNINGVIVIVVRAGRYDQKFISRYFSKLYRFHGI